jgi:hypothetical protein
MGERLILREQAVIENGINELTYSIIRVMPDDDKKSLPGYIYKQMNTANRAAKFAYKSSTDQKREFFSYLRIGFFWTFAAVDKVTAKEYIAVLKEFRKDNHMPAMKDMVDHGLYITTDKNHVWLLGRMAQCTQTGAYTRNLQLGTLGAHIRNWPKKLNLEEVTESDELTESVKLINKVMANTISQFRYVDSLMEVNEEEMRMLLFLDSNKDYYMSHNRISNEFLGSISKKKISFTEKSLLKKMYIQAHVDWRKNEFTITKLGIRIVHKFREQVLKAA